MQREEEGENQTQFYGGFIENFQTDEYYVDLKNFMPENFA